MKDKQSSLILCSLILLLVPLLNSCTEAEGPSQQSPNFIFILVDDMGWSDTACYGSSFYETPNIDRMAASGMRFTDAYAACPVCSPTRASIMTGKYPAVLDITDWIPGRQATLTTCLSAFHSLPCLTSSASS